MFDHTWKRVSNVDLKDSLSQTLYFGHLDKKTLTIDMVRGWVIDVENKTGNEKLVVDVTGLDYQSWFKPHAAEFLHLVERAAHSNPNVHVLMFEPSEHIPKSAFATYDMVTWRGRLAWQKTLR